MSDRKNDCDGCGRPELATAMPVPSLKVDCFMYQPDGPTGCWVRGLVTTTYPDPEDPSYYTKAFAVDGVDIDTPSATSPCPSMNDLTPVMIYGGCGDTPCPPAVPLGVITDLSLLEN